MVCRGETDGSHCERCGGVLAVLDEGMACLECGVIEPCVMRILPNTGT